MALINAFDALGLETTQKDVKRGINDYRTRLDYDTRTDGNPVYVGTAAMTAIDTDNWHILRLTYDSSARLIDKQYQLRSWTSRTEGWT